MMCKIIVGEYDFIFWHFFLFCFCVCFLIHLLIYYSIFTCIIYIYGCAVFIISAKACNSAPKVDLFFSIYFISRKHYCASFVMTSQYDISGLPLKTDNGFRYVIYLEPKPHEEELRIALDPSYIEEVDGRYNYYMDAKLEKEYTKGVKVPYYVSKRGRIIGIPKADPDNSSGKISRIIPIYKKKVILYKSTVPLVVYLPSGARLAYEIMSTMDTGYGVRKPENVLSRHIVDGPL